MLGDLGRPVRKGDVVETPTTQDNQHLKPVERAVLHELGEIGLQFGPLFPCQVIHRTNTVSASRKEAIPDALSASHSIRA